MPRGGIIRTHRDCRKKISADIGKCADGQDRAHGKLFSGEAAGGHGLGCSGRWGRRGTSCLREGPNFIRFREQKKLINEEFFTTGLKAY